MNDLYPYPVVRGVQTIRITSGADGRSDSFIQIGGVVAIDVGRGLNVALASQGALASASSSYGSATPSAAINGQYPARYPDIFHSATPAKSEYFEVVFAAPSTLTHITIFGRRDAGSYRDVYKIALYGPDGTMLFRGTADGSQADGGGTSVDLSSDDLTHAKLRLWREDRPYRFPRLSKAKAVLTIVLKTKNEALLIEKWIIHHSAIVGYVNLIVLDNMSSNERVLSVYDKYSRFIDIIQFDGFHDNLHDSEKFPVLYDAIRSLSDYFIILDTDEFLYLFNDGKFVCNQLITDGLSDLQPKRSIATTWLYTAPGHERRPMCSGPQAFKDGLKWGKTIVGPASLTRGFASHNCQMIVEDFLHPSPVSGFFLFHLTLLSPAQRVKANIAKLVAIGYASELDTAEKVLQRDPKTTMSDIEMYLAEIRQFLNAPEHQTSASDPLVPGVIRLEDDGTAVFVSETEEASFLGLIDDFNTLCRTVFSSAKEPEPEPLIDSLKGTGLAAYLKGLAKSLGELTKRRV